MLAGIIAGIGLLLMIHGTIINHPLEPFEIENPRWWGSLLMWVVGWVLFIRTIKKAQE